jgi:Gluconate 2-dehydrogenase subunit 3
MRSTNLDFVILPALGGNFHRFRRGRDSMSLTSQMTRRDAAWAILRAASVAAAPEFFAECLHSAQSHTHNANNFAPPEPDRWTNYQPKFFSREEIEILDAFTAILIPTDDTPGAREAHVVPFIDFVVAAAAEYDPEMQGDWRAALHFLGEQKFGQVPSAEQVALIEKMSEPGDHSHPAYQLIKDMTVHAFYTSRVGMIDVLEYKGLAYLTEFPGCTHAEHHRV